MRYRKIIIAVLSVLLVVVTAVVATDYGISFYIDQNTSNISSLNSLRVDLDLPVFNVINDRDISRLWLKIKSFRHLAIELANVPNYQAQKQAIIQEFQATVDAYFQKITKYSQLELSFIPNSSEVTAVDFAQMKSASAYLAKYKQSFREAIIKYNQTHTPLRWELDVEVELSKMTLQQKLDQMFVFGILSASLQPADSQFLQKYQPGGIVLIGQNVSNQLLALTNAIQITNPSYLVGILIDQEGGTVKRISADPVGSPKDIVKLTTAVACEQYKIRAELLSSLGVNWNLGIVADVTADSKSFIFQRVYGGDYQTVATQVAQAVTCTDQTLSTLKHFPGHGATNLDTHKTIGLINLDQKIWETTHLLPFVAGMNANVDSVMLGQLKLTAVDADRPATLSAKVVSYIRATLKYDGILITDDLVMLESAGYKWQAAVEQALSAGSDVLLYSSVNNKRDQILDYALSLVNSGKVSATEIDAHVRRILTAKNKLLPSGSVPSELIY